MFPPPFPPQNLSQQNPLGDDDGSEGNVPEVSGAADPRRATQTARIDPAADGDASRMDTDTEAAAREVGGLRGGDALFGLLIAGAVAIGLGPLIGSNAFDMRYTLAWGVLAVFGVLAWLFGSPARIGQERIENVAWGIVFGLILSVPLLGFGGSSLTEGLRLLFTNPEDRQMLSDGVLLAYLVFVMPLCETLYFRGLVQEERTFYTTGLLATVWQLVLFFPLMNRGPYPLIIGLVLLMANTMYAYARSRNGLAAAWICQITVNLVLIFFPLATG